MGSYFNEMVMGKKIIPNIHNRGQKSLESERREFNETLRSEAEEQDRVEHTDGGSEPESELVISVVAENRPKRTRRTNKKRTGKARDK